MYMEVIKYTDVVSVWFMCQGVVHVPWHNNMKNGDQTVLIIVMIVVPCLHMCLRRQIVMKCL